MIRINNTLIDNSEHFMMVEYLKHIIAHDGLSQIKIATGYWDIPGLALVVSELRDFLSKENTELQLLIGADPIVKAYMLANPTHADAKFPEDFIKRDLQELEVKEGYQEAVSLLIDYCKQDESDSKIKIRICDRNEQGETQFFHSKCYIFKGNGFAYGIVGSSNFTQKGLQGNAELNYLETNDYVVKYKPDEETEKKGHIEWFDDKWKLGRPWNQYFLEEVLKPSPIYKKVKEKERERDDDEVLFSIPMPLTPYELYIKLLQTRFADIVDKDLSDMIRSYLPQTFIPLEYQLDAVKQCYLTMKEHGGFMLADVVGLGKTIVGIMLIKHFLLMPEEDGRERRVLIVTPPSIKQAWVDTIEQFDQTEDLGKIFADKVDFITTGSIGKLTDDNESLEDLCNNDTEENDSGEFETALKQNIYGLILIDESHKFRNRGTMMYQALDTLIANIGALTGVYPYIGLLSATPQNNSPQDLASQIYLFQRNHKDATLRKADGGNLEHFFSNKEREYRDIIKPDSEFTPEQRQEQLYAISNEIREKVLCDILIRRTRTDVKKYYSEDMAKQGLKFPKVEKPKPLEYKMHRKLALLFSQTMDIIARRIEDEITEGALGYYRYRAIQYLKNPETRLLYSYRNLDVDAYSKQLAKIMQIGLVKRAESSIRAFRQSLLNFRRATQNMLRMWENDTIFICPDIDVNAELRSDKHPEIADPAKRFKHGLEEIRKKIQKLDETGRNNKKRNREYRRKDFTGNYDALLRKDLEIVDYLIDEWNKITVDPKMDCFIGELGQLFDEEINPNQKLVIFTESKETQQAVVEALEARDYSVLEVSSENRKERAQTIRENFDANYPEELQRDDYQIIVTTDVLAEGINLHRANVILNYDTPWNSTRLMQRIGRVNRIGSNAEEVYVYNFMPSAEGDQEIKLVQKAHTKLQSFHTMFGEDAKVFSDREHIEHYDLPTFSDEEESPLQKYIYELRRYKEENPLRYDYILNCDFNLQQAVADAEGNAYMLVCTARTPGLFIKVDHELEATTLAATEMFESFPVSPLAVGAPLPENWDAICKAAERKLQEEMTRRLKSARNKEEVEKAKDILQEWIEGENISDENQITIRKAVKAIKNGNHDIVRLVLRLKQELTNNSQPMLPGMQDVEMDGIGIVIEKYLSKLVERANEKIGTPYVKIALYK